MVTKNKLLFIFSNLFIPSIELIFISIIQYVYACDIIYYPIISSYNDFIH